MKAYLILFIIMLSIQFWKVETQRSYLFRCFLTFFPLFLYGAFRTACGDYESYAVYFEGVHSGGDLFLMANERMEWGFALLNYVLPSYRMVIVVTSLFVCLSFAYFFYKTVPSKYSWLAITFLFLSADKTFFFWFSGIRNAIAISILMLSVSFIRDRQYIMMALMAAVAVLFHLSAILFFPLAFIVARSKKMERTEFLIWLIVMIVLISTPATIFIEKLFPYVVDSQFERYETYLEEAHDAGILVTIGGVLMALPALFYLYRNKDLSKDDYTIGRLALMFMYSYFLGSLNIRTSQYFIPFVIPFIVTFFYRAKKKSIDMLYVVYCGIFLAYALFVVSMNSVYSPFIMFRSLFN